MEWRRGGDASQPLTANRQQSKEKRKMQHRELRGQSTGTIAKEEKNTGNAEAGAGGDRRKDADKAQYRLTAASEKEKAPNRVGA
jgi:hypothetical protein